MQHEHENITAISDILDKAKESGLIDSNLTTL